MPKGKMKSIYGIYRKHGKDAFFELAACYARHVNPDSVEDTVSEMESRWYDRTQTMTEAEKMVSDYNAGLTLLNSQSPVYKDTTGFAMQL